VLTINKKTRIDNKAKIIEVPISYGGTIYEGEIT